MSVRREIPAAAALLLLTASCSSTSAPACRPTEVASVIESLYFGTARSDGGVVSSEQWQTFLAEVITPRFPAGLTAWSASGQWRDGNNELQRESSYVLSVVHSNTPAQERAVDDVIALYKEQFQQEAVLRVRSPTCVSF